jgi:predicted RNase H-like HicB family nuclease
METTRFVYWQDEGMWLGYLEEFSNYMTQGESLDDLTEHLRDLFDDLSGGKIPIVRQ